VLRPLAGNIERAGLRPQDIAYLPQAAEIDRSFPINVYDLIAMGQWHRAGAFGAIDADARRAIHAAIEAVGLTGFEARQIGTLSGGQMQRALFARILLQDARLILLDEPFAGVDDKTTADLVAIMRRWQGEGRAVLAAVHDLALVKSHFLEALLLAREAVAWGKVADVLTADHLAAARRMCEAFDEDAAACDVEAA
jgi:zinc/manganese transport system ATP-binding protein